MHTQSSITAKSFKTLEGPVTNMTFQCLFNLTANENQWVWREPVTNTTMGHLPKCEMFCPMDPPSFNDSEPVKAKWDGNHWEDSVPTYKCSNGKWFTHGIFVLNYDLTITI